jgi:hypothetical protein
MKIFFPRFTGYGRMFLAMAGCAACTASAEVIFSDNFDGESTVENVSVIDSKVTWEAAGNRTILSIAKDPEGLNSGKVFSIGNNLAMVRIPDTELEVGSSLVLSMRFRSTEVDVQYPAPLRIGLCESRDDSADKGDTVGYWLSTGPGGERKSGISFEQNQDSQIGGGNDSTAIGETFQLGYDWLTPHRLVFKISRPSEGVVEISVQLDDDSELIRTDAKESLTRFNLVALRMANIQQSRLLVDDIKLELLKDSKSAGR